MVIEWVDSGDSDVSFEEVDSCNWLESSFRRKVMYALTKTAGLNLGRQTGTQDADAGEL